MEYKVVTDGSPNEVWATGFYGDYGKAKAQKRNNPIFDGEMPTDKQRLIPPKPFFTNENRSIVVLDMPNLIKPVDIGENTQTHFNTLVNALEILRNHENNNTNREKNN
jgi:hypothetical protein